MTLGEYIKEYRDKHDLSQRQFAMRCNLSNGYISMLENGSNPQTNRPITASLQAIRAIAKAMDTTISELISIVDDMPVDISDISNDVFIPVKRKKIPILGDVACGKPIFAIEESDSFLVVGGDLKADFCVRAHGDSMIGARIHDKDLVFVRKTETVDNGSIAVVLIGDEVTLKRFYYYPSKSTVILKPENHAYEDLIYSNEDLNDIHVLGQAIAFQSCIK